MLKNIVSLSFFFGMSAFVVNAMERTGSSTLTNPSLVKDLQQYKDGQVLPPAVIRGLEQLQRTLQALDPLDKKKDWLAGVADAWKAFKFCFFTSYNDPAIISQFDLDKALKYLEVRLVYSVIYETYKNAYNRIRAKILEFESKKDEQWKAYSYDLLLAEALFNSQSLQPLSIVQLQNDLSIILGDEIRAHYYPGNLASTLLEKLQHEHRKNICDQLKKNADVLFANETSPRAKKVEIDEYHAIRLLFTGGVIAAGLLLWGVSKLKS